MSRLKDLVLHPFLIAAYPVLALLAYNVEQIDSRIALRSLLLCLVFAGVLLLLFRLLFKSWKKAGMLASLTLIFFFSYGRIYAAARLLPLALGRHRLLVPLFLILWAVLVWLVARYRGDLRTGTQTVNIIAMVAMLFPLFSFVQYGINLRNMLDVSRMVIHSAQLREESRGAHYREDFPRQNNEYGLFNLFLKKGDDGKPVFEKRPVELKYMRPE